MAIYGQSNSAYEWNYMPDARGVLSSGASESRRADRSTDRRTGTESTDRTREERTTRNRENRKNSKERRARDAAKQASQEARKQREARQITILARFSIVFAVLILGVILLGAIAFTAYSTSIQSHINKTNLQIRTVDNEITELNLKFEVAFNSKILLEKATEMGMITPEGDRIVYIGDPVQLSTLPENSDFAQFIREKAYESW